MPSSIIGFKDVLLLVIDFDFEMGYLPAVTLLFPILKFLTFWNNNIDGGPGRQRLAVEQEEEKKLKKIVAQSLVLWNRASAKTSSHTKWKQIPPMVLSTSCVEVSLQFCHSSICDNRGHLENLVEARNISPGKYIHRWSTHHPRLAHHCLTDKIRRHCAVLHHPSWTTSCGKAWLN